MLRSLESSDASVQGTNDDAQISKLSCAKAGYFKDEFIQYFVRRASRRSPLINRGYYSRHAALRQLLDRFLAAAEGSGRKPQVLVLGAGFDTTWFQLSRDKGHAPYKCLEVDFREVTQRKAAIMAKEPALRYLLTQPSTAAVAAAPHTPPGEGSAVAAAPAAAAAAASQPPAGPDADAAARASVAPAPASASASAGAPASASASVSGSGSGSGATPMGPAAAEASGIAGAGVELDPHGGRVVSPYYSLLPVDLRSVGALEAAVKEAGLDLRAPTYVLSECVLVYMEQQHSMDVLRWVAQTFPNAVMAVYEQIRPDDAFGRQMVSNLEMRGCPLRGLPATPTVAAHCTRLMDAGWRWADARDMDLLYRTFIDASERTRVERLELFDELEEWHMIQEHYCIALGRNDTDGWLRGVDFDTVPQKGAAVRA